MTGTARATAKKVAAKKSATAPIVDKSTQAAAAAQEKLVEGRKQQGGPGRKTNAQRTEEVVARLSTTPDERGAVMDQLTRYDLCEKLVALRNDAGLSQRELAAKIGSHQPDIGKIENGHALTVAGLQRYVRGLGAKLVISIER